MVISKPELYKENNRIIYSVIVSYAGEEKKLWYSVDPFFGDFLSDSSDAALLALLIPAMHTGENIEVKGSLSARLHHNLNERYQHVLRIIMPWLQKIEINAKHVTSSIGRAEGVATGFSCGVDSYSVLADYHYAKPGSGFNITHLLFNNVGSHSKGGERLFMNRFDVIKQVADKIGLPIIQVNSNVDEFYSDERISFVQTHSLRNASVPLLLQNGIGRYLYASAYNYENQLVRETELMASSDTITLPLLSTNSVDMLSVGSKYTRVEKTIQIAEIRDTYTSLNVCISNDPKAENCSRCKKCMMTQFTLDLIGCLNRYRDVFDLNIYYKRKNRFLTQILRPEGLLGKEILEYAREKNYRFPLSARVRATLKTIIGR